MRKRWVIAGLAAGVLVCGGGLGGQSGPPAAAPRPKRVRAELSGFEISREAGHAPNQTGAASRDPVEVLVVYAPQLGRAFTLTPRFEWQARPYGQPLLLQVAEDAAGGAVLLRLTVTGTTIQYPATAPALKTGVTYVWSVAAETEKAIVPAAARFVIVGGAERQRIAAALAKNTAGPDKAFADARTCRDLRLWYDTVEDYTKLIEAHPEMQELHLQRADVYAQVEATKVLAEDDEAMVKP